MGSGQTTVTTRVLSSLPRWITDTTEANEEFRFEALSLLEEAKAKLADIEAKPPADSASVGVAALHPMHLAVKALLAAKGVRSYSTKASLELLGPLYGEALPASQIEGFVDVQSLRRQGADAIESTKALLGTASTLIGAPS